MATDQANPVLTQREMSILSLAGRGLTNQDIGKELGISANTVKSSLHRACIKIGAKNRVEGVIKAISQKAISIQEIMSPEELADLLETLEPEALDTVIRNIKSKHQRK